MGKRVYREKKLDTATLVAIVRAKITRLEENMAFERRHIEAMSRLPADLNLVTGNNKQHIRDARARLVRLEKDVQIQRDELSRLLN